MINFEIMQIEGYEDEYIRIRMNGIEFFIILEKMVKFQVKAEDAQYLVDILCNNEIYLINPSVDEDIWGNGDIVLNFEVDAISINKLMEALMKELTEANYNNEEIHELLEKVQ